MIHRLIVTGANGSGKSFLAARLHGLRPAVPHFAFDAIKLTRDWQQKSREQIDAELARILAMDAWILEGGPSLLEHALPHAQAVIWLEPPEMLRLWRLASRPWRNLGRARLELPEGNVDWPLQQYRFALSSLRKRGIFRLAIENRLKATSPATVWHCKSQKEIDQVLNDWAKSQ